MKSLVAATAAAVVCASSQAALIYSTDFNTYTNGNISGQTAWSKNTAAPLRCGFFWEICFRRVHNPPSI